MISNFVSMGGSMEPISAVALAALILASSSSAEEFGRQAGHSVWAGLSKLRTLVLAKFRTDSQARQALVQAQEQPENKQAVWRLQAVLEDHAEQDAEFSRQLRQLIDDARQRPEYQPDSTFFANYGWVGKVNIFQAPIHLEQGDFNIN
jgi:hypothetical protein